MDSNTFIYILKANFSKLRTGYSTPTARINAATYEKNVVETKENGCKRKKGNKIYSIRQKENRI